MALDMSANILDGPAGLEPQRMNNGLIYVTIPGMNDSVLQLAVQTFDLPKENQNIVQVSHLNENRKFPGRVDYGDIAVTLNDYIDLDVSNFIATWRKRVYNPANGKVGWKRSFAGQGHIDLFGPNGEYTRSFNLIGVWPSSYDPGQIDQSGDDIIRVNLTLTIDKAVPAPAQPSGNFTTN